MKKLLYFFIGLLLLLGVLYFLAIRYFNNGGTTPTNTVWESYIGRDTTVGILPDQYANYFTYTLARTNNEMGFRIRGEFPDTRYFSFNVYSLGDNVTQGSLIDHQIKTDSGLPNHFVVDKDSVEVGRNFTVHILPSQLDNGDLINTLPFRDDVKLLLMVIRLYDYNVDDFGGVEFPTIEAFTLDDNDNGKEGKREIQPAPLPRPLNLRWIVRRRSLPEMVRRLSLLYETENTVSLDGPDASKKFYTIPFHAIDTKGYIENNDNRYLLSAITKAEEEVYVFRFKSPSFTTGPADINQTEVRYWSFNLGNSETYNFNALKDEDAILDEGGYVNIVLASTDLDIEKRAKELGYNFLEWNMPWKKGLILFRHMLANPNFEAQIDRVPAISEDMDDFAETEAQHYLGDFAPRGIRMSKADFLSSYNSSDTK